MDADFPQNEQSLNGLVTAFGGLLPGIGVGHFLHWTQSFFLCLGFGERQVWLIGWGGGPLSPRAKEVAFMATLGREKSPCHLSQHHQRRSNQAAGGSGSGWTQPQARVAFGMLSWPPARVTGAASLQRDELTRTMEGQAYASWL